MSSNPRGHPVRCWRQAGVLGAVGVALLSVALTQEGPPKELTPAEWRAGVISKLPAYIEWPADRLGAETNAIRIGVLTPAPPEDEVVTYLTALFKDTRVNGRLVQVSALERPGDAAAYHLVYVPESANAAWWATASALDQRGLVTVGEAGDFVRRGGVFRLIPERRRLQVNVRHADQAGVRLNPRLLRVCDVTR